MSALANAVTGKAIRVLIVDDHPVVRTGLASILSSQPEIIVLPAACSGREALELYARDGADVVLLDLRMPEMSGIETLRQLRTAVPPARVLVITNYETDEEIHTAIGNGALGYLTKDVMQGELLQAIKVVAAGRRHIPPELASRLSAVAMRPSLTARESEILQLLVTGWTNKRIGHEMGISENTVRNHVNHVFEKLCVTDRTEAVIVALQRGLVKIDGM